MTEADMQSSAQLDIAQVLAAMRQLGTGLKTMETATKQLNQAQQDYASKASKTFREIGALIGKIPGMGGLKEVFDQAGDGHALFARLGVGISLVAFGMQAYNSVIDANIDRMKLLNEAQNKYVDILYKTRDAQDSTAKAGLAQNTSDYRRAVAAGGPQAVADAKGLEATGNFSHDLALQLVGQLYQAFGAGRQTQGAIGGLKMGAQVGMDPNELLQTLLHAGGSLGNPAIVKQIVAEQLNTSRSSYQGGTPMDYLNDQLKRTQDDAFLKTAAENAAKAAAIAPAQRDKAIAFGGRATGADVSAAQNPGLALMTEHYRQQQRQWANDQKVADEERGFRQWWKDSWIMLLMGGQGSLQHQLNRKQEAEGNALFGTPPPPPKPAVEPYMSNDGFTAGG